MGRVLIIVILAAAAVAAVVGVAYLLIRRFSKARKSWRDYDDRKARAEAEWFPFCYPETGMFRIGIEQRAETSWGIEVLKTELMSNVEFNNDIERMISFTNATKAAEVLNGEGKGPRMGRG